MRLVPVLCIAAMLLSGCGGGSDGDKPAEQSSTSAKAPSKAPRKTPSKAPSKATETAPAPKARAKTIPGKPAPQHLSQFVCAPLDDGDWKAAGALRNEGKASATYRVRVYLGQADGKSRAAKTKNVGVIAAGQSQRFTYKSLPKADRDEQCFVQVLRQPTLS